MVQRVLTTEAEDHQGCGSTTDGATARSCVRGSNQEDLRGSRRFPCVGRTPGESCALLSSCRHFL